MIMILAVILIKKKLKPISEKKLLNLTCIIWVTWGVSMNLSYNLMLWHPITRYHQELIKRYWIIPRVLKVIQGRIPGFWLKILNRILPSSTKGLLFRPVFLEGQRRINCLIQDSRETPLEIRISSRYSTRMKSSKQAESNHWEQLGSISHHFLRRILNQ